MRLKSTVCVAALLMCLPLAAEDEGWPKEIESKGYIIQVYQPQIDDIVENEIQGRAAVSVKQAGSAPVFGAVWIDAKIATDRNTRTVDILTVDVPTVRFPEASEEQQQRLATLLETEIPKWDLEISMDRLMTSLDGVEGPPGQADLNNDPPKIIFKNEPAVLVLIDGEPIMEDVENSKLQRVVNTPYLIVYDPGSKAYYLASNEVWFSARMIDGPWREDRSPPKEIASIEIPKSEEPEDEEMETDPRVPEIVVSTVPAELIFIDGEPNYTPMSDADLLYVNNTDSDVVYDIGEQQIYVLLSGRWFKSRAAEGPWTHVPNDQLPAAFNDIPKDSENGHMRASVAGTEEAREAVLDAEIPQTAEVKRDATTTVEYDGKPQFEDVESTEVQYAVNTEKQVFKYKKTYYCCDEAVWYESSSATGPWKVCTDVPKEIYDIPASNPNHNVTYVTVYETTPEVVYVGYTPGYVNSYYYGGCMVYGTGWYYRPWYHHHYYARPATWGFHVRWNPWYGWSFGLSYSNGPFRLTIGTGGYGGWWGPRYYRPYPRYGYRAGYRAGYRHGYYHGSNRPSHYNRGNVNINTGDININNNIYNRPSNRDKVNTTDNKMARNRPKTAEGVQNNVLTDKNGNVYRRNNDGSWDQRDKGGWNKADVPAASTREARPSQPTSRPAEQPTLGGGNLGNTGANTRPSTGAQTRPSTQPQTRPSTQPQTRPSTGQQPSTSSLNRDYANRQRGSQRTQSYQGSRSGGGYSRGGGGAARGGRR
jgi:hypothetical protein